VTKNNTRKEEIRAHMDATGETYNVTRRHTERLTEQDGLFPAPLPQPTRSATPPLQPDRGEGAGNSGNGLIWSAAWPEEPEPVNPGEGTRADRLRMLQHMRNVWNAVNSVRRDQVKVEVQAARERQAEVAGYWDRHRALVKERWASRTGGRGETTESQLQRSSAVQPARIGGNARSASAMHRGRRGPRTASRRVPAAPPARSSSSSATSRR
jgi:hypothetical protein